ncbi:MAG: hypothetical protein K1X79_11780 [Oligoflexia bacterium]|nr:hypothetical protein [Oligoflexia bacterium]
MEIALTLVLLFSLCFPLLGLCLPLLVILDLAGLPATSARVLACVALAAVPAAGLFAAEMFEHCVASIKLGKGVRSIAILAGALVALETGIWADVLTGLAAYKQGLQVSQVFVILSALVSKIIFCGALVVLPAALLLASLELLYNWLRPGPVPRWSIPVPAIRLVVMLLVISLAGQLIVGAWQSELGPQAILAMLKR